MCHEYEAWWWQREAAPQKKAIEPKPRDIVMPEPKPAEPATAGARSREAEKELVPAE